MPAFFPRRSLTPLAERPRVLQVVTQPASANLFMRGQLHYLRDEGFDVAVAASPGEALEQVRQREAVPTFGVPMAREISPRDDVAALRHMTAVIRRYRPHILNAGTPKAGLLGMAAARLTNVPIRIYTVRGLRLETTQGWKRQLLMATEKIACRCADTVLCVSPSLSSRVAELGLADKNKLLVLGDGSSNGVRSERFAPTRTNLAVAAGIAAQLGLPASGSDDQRGRVVGFVGRLTADKGIVELARAFQMLKQQRPDARLLLVGDFEAGDPVPAEVRQQLICDPAVTITGFVADSAPYYHLMGQLVLPSHREGFPNVPLEAAAAELPVVAFDATGSRDAVVDQQTGRLVPLGDVEALSRCIAAYLASPPLRRRHGLAGRRRVETCFAPHRIWQALAALYRSRLEASLPGVLATPQRQAARAA